MCSRGWSEWRLNRESREGRLTVACSHNIILEQEKEAVTYSRKYVIALQNGWCLSRLVLMSGHPCIGGRNNERGGGENEEEEEEETKHIGEKYR
jgi:hypothetical protein